MGARRPKPTALKERTSVRPQMGLSRLFAAANALVPFHQYDEESDRPAKTDLRVVPDTQATIEDKTLAIGDPRLTTPSKLTDRLELAPQPVFDSNKHLDPFPQFDPEAFKRAVDPARDSVLPDEKQAPLDEESNYGTAIRVPNKSRRAPPRETKTNFSVGTPTSVTKLKKNEDAKKQTRTAKASALVLLVAAISLIAYGLLSTETSMTSQTAARKSALTPEQIQERLSYYRTITGGKLNRDRIDVQIQNFKTAPNLGALDQKVKPPSVMDGLPLQGETRAKNTKDLPYDPTYSEAKIAYGLQEEQERIKFEKLAREAWIQEFIDNARRDGVDVKIDDFGNVTTRELKPEEMQQPLFGQ